MKSSEKLGAGLLHCLPRSFAEDLEGPKAGEELELALHPVLTPLAQRWRFDGILPG